MQSAVDILKEQYRTARLHERFCREDAKEQEERAESANQEAEAFKTAILALGGTVEEPDHDEVEDDLEEAA